MTNKIVIVAGDPNSINSEILYKTWKNLDKKTKNKIYLIANFKLISQQFKKLRCKINLNKMNALTKKSNLSSLNIIDVPLRFNNPFNVSKKETIKYLAKSLDLAHSFAKQKKNNWFYQLSY